MGLQAKLLRLKVIWSGLMNWLYRLVEGVSEGIVYHVLSRLTRGGMMLSEFRLHVPQGHASDGVSRLS